jgi:2-polyprenyl-6-methoxyphenol hydroxylase-like FAD-dependent oxidoreductase
VGSILRGQLYPSHAQFERLPYLNIQMKLTTKPSQLPKSLDAHGINLITGTANYSLLLVPFHPQKIPAKDHSLLIVPSPTSTAPPITDTIDQVSEEPGFLFAILTTQTFEGWQETTQWGWKNKVVESLEADQADDQLIRAFKQDIIPGTICSPWQAVRCDPDDPVPYDGGKVMLIGDAAHAMPPQA